VEGRVVAKEILIVDDNATVRKSLRQILEQNSDWKVCGEAVNGREAIEQAQRLRPDLVVLDFSMPVMNGLEAASMLKHMRPALPLVMLTAYKDRFLEEQAHRAGISGVISKGDDMTALMDLACLLLKYGSPDYAKDN
jgi:DNA-binding NarL/FixJ family response regulator